MPLSAGDWTRIKRVQSARDYGSPSFGVIATKKDVINVATHIIPSNNSEDHSRVVGSSRIRREASKWTDFVASRAQGYVVKSERFNTTTNLPTGVSQNTLVNINCNCRKIIGANSTVLNAKSTGCIKCKQLGI